MASILVDLWGVVCNSEEAGKSYRLVMSEILQGEYGGDRRSWLRAHDEAYLWQAAEATAAEKRALPYRTFVDRMYAEHIRKVFDIAGVPFPAVDPLAFGRELERRVLSKSASAYPDVWRALSRLREAGHSIYLATQAAESNAAGAVQGAGVGGLFDGILTGDVLDAFKSDPVYWRRALTRIGRSGEGCVAVDDTLRYLEAATTAGITCLLLDRLGVQSAESVPPFVRAVLRHLAGLPQFVEAIRGGPL